VGGELGGYSRQRQNLEWECMRGGGRGGGSPGKEMGKMVMRLQGPCFQKANKKVVTPPLPRGQATPLPCFGAPPPHYSLCDMRHAYETPLNVLLWCNGWLQGICVNSSTPPPTSPPSTQR
jgi:hypothetical protein